jgi:pimeloyl-ACP methyl ester carboxylesterase
VLSDDREVRLLKEVDPTEVPARDEMLALRRLGTYVGIIREVGFVGLNVALWPLGLVDEAARIGSSRVRRRYRNQQPRPLANPSEAAAEVPIILVHGYFHNRSGLLLTQRALRKHGFQNVAIFSYNPLRKGIPSLADGLRRKVEATLERTGADKVHIVGHSLGGLIARYYVEHLEGKDKVHTLVSLGTPHHGTMMAFLGRSASSRQMRPGSEFLNLMAEGPKPPEVRYLCYYSNLDSLVVPSRSATLPNGDGCRVTNIIVNDLGHLSLLINSELIDSVAENLSNLD